MDDALVHRHDYYYGCCFYSVYSCNDTANIDDTDVYSGHNHRTSVLLYYYLLLLLCNLFVSWLQPKAALQAFCGFFFTFAPEVVHFGTFWPPPFSILSDEKTSFGQDTPLRQKRVAIAQAVIITSFQYAIFLFLEQYFSVLRSSLLLLFLQRLRLQRHRQHRRRRRLLLSPALLVSFPL